MTVIYDNNTDHEFEFASDDFVRELVSKTCEILECPYEVSVSVSVVNEDEIHRLNNEFRDIDRATDVLSFPMNEYDAAGVFDGDTFEASLTTDPDTDELMLGDVIICAQKVKAQAEEYGHSEKREFAFLVVHSLLHLCGFDHIEDSDRLVMESKQKEILDLLGINRF